MNTCFHCKFVQLRLKCRSETLNTRRSDHFWLDNITICDNHLGSANQRLLSWLHADGTMKAWQRSYAHNMWSSFMLCCLYAFRCLDIFLLYTTIF